MRLRPISIVSFLMISGCATASGARDMDTPAAVVEAVDLTCGWLIQSASPPSREEMDRLNWTQFMVRENASGLPETLGSARLEPALAGYQRTFGESGEIIASYWENRCYGILSSDREPDPVAMRTRAEQGLAALKSWIESSLPNAVPVAANFPDGVEKPYTAFANSQFAFHAVLLQSGGLEWQLRPTSPAK